MNVIAKLWADQIIDGKKTFAEVPRLLKDKVRQNLIDAGKGELANEAI